MSEKQRKKEEAIDCPFFDRRRKLLPCQEEMVQLLHSQGQSISYIANVFLKGRISRGAIYFIVDPEARMRTRRTPPKKQSREYHTEAKKKYREFKKTLIKKGH